MLSNKILQSIWRVFATPCVGSEPDQALGSELAWMDVRFVAHLDLPKTVEAYYQETGRAGRDGQAADAWLVYGLQDVITLRQMLDQSQGGEDYKRAERHRLNAMLGLCEITTCRRRALLALLLRQHSLPSEQHWHIELSDATENVLSPRCFYHIRCKYR